MSKESISCSLRSWVHQILMLFTTFSLRLDDNDKLKYSSYRRTATWGIKTTRQEQAKESQLAAMVLTVTGSGEVRAAISTPGLESRSPGARRIGARELARITGAPEAARKTGAKEAGRGSGAREVARKPESKEDGRKPGASGFPMSTGAKGFARSTGTRAKVASR